jgi:hypothetical protein
LPELELKEIKADFAFIDGWHTFDHTLVDFFLTDKILRKGGILALDDTNWDSVRKVSMFILRNRSYKLIDFKPGLPYPPLRSLANTFYKSALKFGFLRPYLEPESYGGKLDRFTRGGFLILQKENDDIRNYDHYVPF